VLPTWIDRLLAIPPTKRAADPPVVSTLEAFFAETRWLEDVRADGERTLRPRSM
jgi:hypothetical protein